MSERIHSPASHHSPHEASQHAAPKRSRRFVAIIAGTAAVLVAAGVILQTLRAQPAASQTGEQPGQARVQASAADMEYLGRVNNQPITYDQVARECVARFGAEVLDNLINRVIIQQECQKRGIEVTEQEIAAEIAETAKKFGLEVDVWYQMLQAERNLTPPQYRQDVIWPMLALKKLAGTEVQVTESDMQHAFERDYGPRVEARMILISGELRHANKVWEMARTNPDNFSKLAQEYSADPNSRALGGMMPPIRRHGGSATVENEAFKLEVGEISPVIEVGHNRHVILKCEGRTTPKVQDIREVWTELYAQLVEEKTQEAVAKTFETLKENAQVHNFLKNTSTGRAPFAAPGSGPIRQTAGAGQAKAPVRNAN